MKDQTDLHFLFQKGVLDDLFFPALISDNHLFAALGCQADLNPLGFKVCFLHLFQIDQIQNQTIGKRGAELFHQIQRQAGAPRPVDVQIAHKGIQSHGLERGAHVRGQQYINKRQQGVDSIQRRSTVASVELKRVLLLQNQAIEHVEITVGRLALQTAQPLHIRTGLDPG